MSGVLIILSPCFSQDAGKQEQLGHASRATQDRKQACQAAHGHAGFSVNSRVRVDVISARHLIGVKCLPVRRRRRPWAPGSGLSGRASADGDAARPASAISLYVSIVITRTAGMFCVWASGNW